jgi:hypothetical protein
LFINPIPFIPFPLIRGRGGIFERGAMPLLNTLINALEFKESQREAKPLLHNHSPSPLLKG